MEHPNKRTLIELAKKHLSSDDPSHDLEHALRVMRLAESLAESEGADLEVVIPAALLHDVVNYPKDNPRASLAQNESADKARELLFTVPGISVDKIEQVEICIRECSFSKGLVGSTLESRVLQDADGLEATGAISIMRTFASSGTMHRPFYHHEDPFCKQREPEPKKYALDLFFVRLLVVRERMHTAMARKIAEERTRFLHVFLYELEKELQHNTKGTE